MKITLSLLKKSNLLKIGVFSSAFVLFYGCTPKEQTTLTFNETKYPITLTNSLATERTDEAIVITRAQLTELTTSFGEETLPYISDEAGKSLVSQTDDLDGDGKWDELAFLYNFKPNEKAIVNIQFVSKDKMPSYAKRTDAALLLSPNRDKTGYQRVNTETRPKETDVTKTVLSYQMEGPAWENDKVAFRSYFDPRNGKDIFGKITDSLCLDSIGVTGDYHKMQYWGMDILKVGNSLGAGALAVYENKTLIRLGETDTSSYQFVSAGAVRAILKLIYKGWDINGKKIDVIHKISIYAGKYYYQSDVTLVGFEGEKELVTGIVNMKLEPKEMIERDNNEGYISIATHGKQSENEGGDILGMGLVFKKADVIAKETAPQKEKWEGTEVVNTYYARLKATANIPVTFRFFACWEKTNPEFAQKEAFLQLIQQEADKLNSPIVVVK
jgi:hypothetical protein